MRLDAATVVSAILAVSVLFLLVLGAASMMGLFKGASELRRLFRAASADYSPVILKSPLVPGVSVLVVARDATAEARALVRRLLSLHFGKHEVVLVLDGPSDAARAAWVEELRLLREERSEVRDLPARPVRGFYVSREPLKLLVVDMEPGGDADAFNAAINAAQYPVLGFVDPRADFIPEWLLRLMRPLLEDWNRIAAVCAVAMPAPVEGWAGRIGRLETLRRWMVRGAAFARWGKLAPIPGSCMLIKRQPLVAAGGFRGGVLELFLDLQAGKQQIAFLPWLVSWDKAPATFSEVREQIRYDQSQLARGLRYRTALYGGAFAGLFCVRVLRPMVETVALPLAAVGLILGWVHPALAGLTLLASAGVGMVLSAAAIVLYEMADPGLREPRYMVRLFLTAIAENLGYRQIRNLWLIAAFFR